MDDCGEVDNQIVTVALPTIERQMDTGEAALQWISAGYALGFGLTLITGGRLGDRYGRKRLFVIGMAGFTAASLLAGLAPDVGVLIAARVAQGIGSGLMVPQVLSFVLAEFDATERPRAMALYAAAFPLGGLAGPLFGGVLTEADLFGFGWRAIFLVNRPIGVLAAAGALIAMPARPRVGGQRVDLRDLVLLAAGLFAAFFPLVQGRELGWPMWTVALFGVAVVLFGVNAAVGVFFVLTLHPQSGLGFTPLRTALTFLPATVGIVAGNVVAIRCAGRIGRAFVAGAIGVLLLSLGAIALLVAAQGTGLSSWALLGPAVGLGLGMGAGLNAVMTLSTAGVAPEHAGAASGLVNTTAQLATATGIAVFGTVFFALPKPTRTPNAAEADSAESVELAEADPAARV